MLSTSWLLCGGGLANALLASRLHKINRDFLLIEKNAQLFNGQTWSCQLTDADPEDRAFLTSLATATWPGYEVRFPSYARTIMSTYVTIRSEDLRARLNIPDSKIAFNTRSPAHPMAENVVRAEGFSTPPTAAGWQKFVGYDVEFEKPHGRTLPLLMDADVEQIGGYRFFYLLPFGPRRMLVEETRYSDDRAIDHSEFADGIRNYLAQRFAGQRWTKEREESGSLPIPWEDTGVRGQFGVAGGFFHPSTGYSLPAALRTSRRLIEEGEKGLSADQALIKISKEESASQSFFYTLNRMMFLACRPEQRRKIFERFYRFDEGFIRRFYASRVNTLDKIRMLSGRPPVKVSHAMRALVASEPVWK